MRTTYTEEFKQAAVMKLLNRGNRTLSGVAAEIGITPSVACGWIKKSAKIGGLITKKEKSSAAWTGQEKFQAVIEFEVLRDQPEKQGEFLRKVGLHAVLVESWRKEVLGVLTPFGRRPKRTSGERAKDQQIVELKRDLHRKDKALAETAALLILKKKAELIWGLVDEEESA